MLGFEGDGEGAGLAVGEGADVDGDAGLAFGGHQTIGKGFLNLGVVDGPVPVLVIVYLALMAWQMSASLGICARASDGLMTMAVVQTWGCR